MRRLPVVARACRFPNQPPQGGSDWARRDFSAPGIGLQEVAAALEKRGYRTRVELSKCVQLAGEVLGKGAFTPQKVIWVGGAKGLWVEGVLLREMLLLEPRLGRWRLGDGKSVEVDTPDTWPLRTVRLGLQLDVFQLVVYIDVFGADAHRINRRRQLERAPEELLHFRVSLGIQSSVALGRNAIRVVR